jgi:predicted O-methyltransferase YrrM
MTLDAALHHLNDGDLAEAERVCLDLLARRRAGDDTTRIRLILATAYLGQRRHAEALPILKAHAEGPASHPATIDAYGDCLAELGYIDQAVEQYRRIASPSPTISDKIAILTESPFFPICIGSHQPARQAYMAATVHRLRHGKGPLRILEIGSFMGASAYTWANAVAALTRRWTTLHCVDPWDADAMAGVKDDAMATATEHGTAGRLFRHNLRFFPPQAVVSRFQGISRRILPTLSGPYDLIYIDGSHLFDDVLWDLRAAAALLAEGGVLCGDDLESQLAETGDTLARASIDRDIAPGPGPDGIFHPGVTLAVAEMFGPVSAYRGYWIMRKRDGGFHPVPLSGATGWLPRHWPEELQKRAAADILSDGILAGLV